MKYERRIKAESIAQKIVSEYLGEYSGEFADDFQIITVTDVTLSPELSYLDVSVSALKNGKELPKMLAPHATEIERLLAKKMPLIKIPRVRFRPNNDGEKLFNISHKLNSLSDSLDD